MPSIETSMTIVEIPFMLHGLSDAGGKCERPGCLNEKTRYGPPASCAVSRISRSVDQPLYVPQLFGVPHYVDGFDLAGFDKKGRGLQHAVRIARDEAGQAIHECVPDQFGITAPQAENSRKAA